MSALTPQRLISLIDEVAGPLVPPLAPQSPLVGPGSAITSMQLVQICLRLEDEADALGGRFDWTSEKAMSQLAGLFASVEALCDQFNRQLEH